MTHPSNGERNHDVHKKRGAMMLKRNRSELGSTRRNRSLRSDLCTQSVVAAVIAAGVALLTPGVSAAATTMMDEATGSELQEVIVTAQRRTENLQDVPIAVQAFSADTLSAAGIDSVRDLSMVSPSLQFADAANWGQVYVRGIGSPAIGPGIESPVAIYVDGVYWASETASAVEFNNIQSIEVLNGPQGTLFGRNADGGLIQVHTKDPSQTFGGDVDAGYGNYQTTTADAYVTGGIADHVAADLAVQVRYQQQGFGTNLYDGTELDYNRYTMLRSKWLFTPTDDLTIKLSGDYEHAHGTYAIGPWPGTIPLGGPNPVPPHYNNEPYDSRSDLNQEGVSATVAYRMDFATLTSISAWRQTYFNHNDVGTSPAGLFQYAIHEIEPHTQYSQELQLASPAGSSFTWTAGAYYFYEISKWTPATPYSGPCGGFGIPVAPTCDGYIPTNPNDIQIYVTNRTESWALYAQATKEIFDRTNLTLGIRDTNETRNYDNAAYVYGSPFGYLNIDGSAFYPGGPAFHGDLTMNQPTWRIALDHKFTDQVMAYVSYNRGFKSGGFTSPTVAPLEPETLNAAEIGLKSEFLDRRLRLNVAAYDYDYKNIQVNSYVGNFPTFVNGASARLYGLDTTLNAIVTHNFSVNAAVSLEHTKFDQFPNSPSYEPNPVFPYGNIALGPNGTGLDAAGNQLPRAPKFAGNVSGTYTHPLADGDLGFTALYSYDSGWYTDSQNRLKQGGYGTLNLSADWKSARGFGVQLWGKNLTDETYASYAASSGAGDLVSYTPPRTYGITLSQKF